MIPRQRPREAEKLFFVSEGFGSFKAWTRELNGEEKATKNTEEHLEHVQKAFERHLKQDLKTLERHEFLDLGELVALFLERSWAPWSSRSSRWAPTWRTARWPSRGCGCTATWRARCTSRGPWRPRPALRELLGTGRAESAAGGPRDGELLPQRLHAEEAGGEEDSERLQLCGAVEGVLLVQESMGKSRIE